MLWAGVGEDILGVIRLMYAENPAFGTFLLLLLYSKYSDHQYRC
jgi:hypothetical protein